MRAMSKFHPPHPIRESDLGIKNGSMIGSKVWHSLANRTPNFRLCCFPFSLIEGSAKYPQVPLIKLVQHVQPLLSCLLPITMDPLLQASAFHETFTSRSTLATAATLKPLNLATSLSWRHLCRMIIDLLTAGKLCTL